VGFLNPLADASSWRAAAERAAQRSSISQAWRGDWSWRSVKAPVIGAGVGSAVGSALHSDGMATDLGKPLGNFG
jgi:hypothetical protein